MDITDIYEHCYIYKTKDYTFFTVSHGTLFRTDHILYRNTEVTPCTLSDRRGLELEINSNRKDQHNENWDKGRN